MISESYRGYEMLVLSILRTVHADCRQSLWTVDDGGQCAIRVCGQLLLARLEEKMDLL